MADQVHQDRYAPDPAQLAEVRRVARQGQKAEPAGGRTPSQLADVISRRVTYDEAAEMLCKSREQLRRLVRDGEIPVLQRASGRQPALIEVSAIQDYLDRLRSQANRDAAAARRRAAAKRGSAA